MNPTSLWNEMTRAALLGTGRQPFVVPEADGTLGVLLAQLNGDDSEAALLRAAAVVALHRRAGYTPAKSPPLPAPAPHDERQPCSRRAAQYLGAILSGQQRSLLPEWLTACAAARRRVPDAWLPNLLELARTQPSMRPFLQPAIGRRGAWLAALNPAWNFAIAAELPADPAACQAAWETAPRAERLSLLAQLRTSDPAAAREMLAGSWAAEKADDRATFLALFEQGLSLADEPMLEAALEDRSKEVRRVAISLLLGLPESALVLRMRDRAAAILAWQPASKATFLGLKSGKPVQLLVTPPESADRAMQRDGIEPKPPANRRSIGERAWLVEQIVRAVPPSTWTAAWGVSAAEILQATTQNEWAAPLRLAWSQAAQSFGDAVWAEALLQADPHSSALFGVLEPQRQEALLLRLLRGDCVPLHRHPVLSMLRSTNEPWSPQLSRAAMTAVYQHMRRFHDSNDYQLRSALVDDFVHRLPPEMGDEIQRSWPKDAEVRERWQGPIDRLLFTLQFRREMLAALVQLQIADY